MTGWDFHRRVSAELQRAEMDPRQLSHTHFHRLLLGVMDDVHEQVSIYSARKKFTTIVDNRYVYKPTWLLEILKASNERGDRLASVSPLQYPGLESTDYQTPGDPPTAIWLEYNEVAGRDVVGVDPIPSVAHVIRLTVRHVLPAYENMSLNLPTRAKANGALFAGLMARLFEGEDFHSKSKQMLWEAKLVRRIEALRPDEDRVVEIEGPHDADFNEDGLGDGF